MAPQGHIPPAASVLGTIGTILLAGVEVLLIFVLTPPYKRGISWPLTLIGVVAAILLAAGLVPPYFEFAKTKGRVLGINFAFLFIDFAGGLFSLLALVAQQKYDILGGTQYIAVILLELGIFTSHFVWLYRTRRVRREARFVGLTYDEYVDYGEPRVLVMCDKYVPSGIERLQQIHYYLNKGRRYILPKPTLPPAAGQAQNCPEMVRSSLQRVPTESLNHGRSYERHVLENEIQCGIGNDKGAQV
ncbi:MAG: hypothetical protein M1821_007705 [Bathelium mastoideum]|nr:MAG: hypothetical protein M1821_007705 [Bathelium mastoideum]